MRFYTCDVFTDERYGGNPLAVLPDARGLDDASMQRIAREFGYSETTFVLPPEQGGTRRVRIFTPTQEVPFAGHPNVGTAFALAHEGDLGALPDASAFEVVFEEAAGLVPVSIELAGGRPTRCELRAPQPFERGVDTTPARAAAALSLAPDAISTAHHAPCVASVGLPFLLVELRDRTALERACIDLAALGRLAEDGLPVDLYAYVRRGDDAEAFDVRARMFAPLDGVPEDPATGSATGAAAGLIASLAASEAGELRLRFAQGVEMGRPSVLEARVERSGGPVGAVGAVRVAGRSVMMSRGELVLD